MNSSLFYFLIYLSLLPLYIHTSSPIPTPTPETPNEDYNETTFKVVNDTISDYELNTAQETLKQVNKSFVIRNNPHNKRTQLIIQNTTIETVISLRDLNNPFEFLEITPNLITILFFDQEYSKMGDTTSWLQNIHLKIALFKKKSEDDKLFTLVDKMDVMKISIDTAIHNYPYRNFARLYKPRTLKINQFILINKKNIILCEVNFENSNLRQITRRDLHQSGRLGTPIKFQRDQKFLENILTVEENRFNIFDLETFAYKPNTQTIDYFSSQKGIEFVICDSKLLGKKGKFIGVINYKIKFGKIERSLYFDTFLNQEYFNSSSAIIPDSKIELHHFQITLMNFTVNNQIIPVEDTNYFIILQFIEYGPENPSLRIYYKSILIKIDGETGAISRKLNTLDMVESDILEFNQWLGQTNKITPNVKYNDMYSIFYDFSLFDKVILSRKIKYIKVKSRYIPDIDFDQNVKENKRVCKKGENMTYCTECNYPYASLDGECQPCEIVSKILDRCVCFNNCEKCISPESCLVLMLGYKSEQAFPQKVTLQSCPIGSTKNLQGNCTGCSKIFEDGCQKCELFQSSCSACSEDYIVSGDHQCVKINDEDNGYLLYKNSNHPFQKILSPQNLEFLLYGMLFTYLVCICTPLVLTMLTYLFRRVIQGEKKMSEICGLSLRKGLRFKSDFESISDEKEWKCDVSLIEEYSESN